MKEKIKNFLKIFDVYKVDYSFDDGVNEILSLISEEIEKELNGREEDMIADADYKEGWLDCRHWILTLLKKGA